MMLKPSRMLLISSVIARATAFRAAPSNTLISLATSRQNVHMYTTIAKYAHQSMLQTHLRATIMPQESQEVNTSIDLLRCKLCQRSFGSRNAIFRHLRGEDTDDSDCYVKAAKYGMHGAKTTREKEISLTAVIRYGYLVRNRDAELFQRDETRDIQYRTGYNEFVANTIQETFVNLTTHFIQGELPNSGKVTTSALSWSTAAKLRQPSLKQDDDVLGSASEVLSFNYRLIAPQTSNRWNEYASSNKILQDIQSELNVGIDKNDVQIQLHAMDALVPRSTKFYAERSCSQRSYRFLLPIRWLNFENDHRDNREHLVEWVSSITSTSLSERRHQPRSDSAISPPECIINLKQVLKAAESKTVPNRKTRRQAGTLDPSKEGGTKDQTSGSLGIESNLSVTNTGPIRLSPGRYGQLWRKERKCWSNFCHTELRGMAASPSHDATWHSIDKSSIVDIINLGQSAPEAQQLDELSNTYVVIEFRGDGFLLGQLPRLISSIVAMTNGWLPSNFFDLATRPDIYIATPPVSPFTERILYFHSPRYHFHELTAKSEVESHDICKLSNCITSTDAEYSWEKEIRKDMLIQTPQMNSNDEIEWLKKLRDEISTSIKLDIQATLKNIENIGIGNNAIDEENEIITELPTNCPGGAYAASLKLLREIVENKEWPNTSMARSRVIKTPFSKQFSTEAILTTKKGSVSTVFPGNAQSSGSFTVVNMDLWEEDSGVPLPVGNSRFPQLAKSIFDLEKEVIENQTPIPRADGMTRGDDFLRSRPPSTHCAVNRNAQFTPHVDSGRGLGQSLSMIVGLGNYAGGEVIVEGKKYPIRYKALEFDGWKQLHWTAPFSGERYSLVYFTPDIQREEQVKLDGNRNEDLNAEKFAEMHSYKTPFLPPMTYRVNSTDTLVIKEILDPDSGCAYTLERHQIPNMPDGFSVKGHSVLDIGAHIGVFSRYAIEMGCVHIIAYEPEPENFKLLSKNIFPNLNQHVTIDIHPKAVSNGSDKRTLVRARNENDGNQNTWRHSLAEYSQYVDRSVKLPSESQKTTLDRVEVQSIQFFGGALETNITFVKLDCEGAEIEILLNPKASNSESWLDVTHLVLEWSFTKERRVEMFHKMLSNLKSAGFEVYYEGMGSWWDQDAQVLWPYPKDLLVFALRSAAK